MVHPGLQREEKKGGHVSQIRRRLRPELYKNCILKKEYSLPEYSKDQAELVGIILGDGGITESQLVITLNHELEQEYINYVADLSEKVFGEEPRKYYSSGRPGKVCDIVISGVGLIDVLSRLGLEKGNKVSKQARVPTWIIESPEFSKRCLRGLVDTDGCVFHHKHTSNGCFCFNLGLTYTSHSFPLLDFVYETLLAEGFNPKIQDDSVYLYREAEVVKYADEIGFSNSHHRSRYNQFFEKKYRQGEVREPGLIDRLGESA